MHQDVSRDKRFLELNKLLEELKCDYGISKEEVLKAAEDIKIPVSIFSYGLSSYESIVKFIYENKARSISEIALITGRSKQNAWQACNNALKKCKKKFLVKESQHDFPVSVIANPKYSSLESIVKFLKESHSLSYAEISRILFRDQRTVWTVYSRTKKK